MNRVEFLQQHYPFSLLPLDVLTSIADILTETSYSKDTLIYQQEVTKMKTLDVIVSGFYESFFYDADHQKKMVELHGAGYSYGGISILMNRKRSIKNVIARKGTVVYSMPRKDFRTLCKTYENFFQYFTRDFSERMMDDEFVSYTKKDNPFEESFIASERLYSRKLDSIEVRKISYCHPSTPIYLAAQQMNNEKSSCLVIKDEQKVLGFITDLLLRERVIATNLDLNTGVGEVMDPSVAIIDSSAYVYEAVLKMFSSKKRYLLIEEEGELKGIISRNKLLSEQGQSPLVYIQSVKLAHSLDELKSKWEQVPQMITQLMSRGVKPEIINQIITSIADTIAQNVIESVIQEVGEPPAKFVFMVLGSEGRMEQTLRTDQDNAIIYEDKANEHREEVRAYFLKFADIVSERLNYIGFVFCSGGYMAKNPAWTHSLSHWKRNYEAWMSDSLPETAIKFSTFFDCRHIYGDASIIEELIQFLDNKLQEPMEKLFFHMAKNALQYQPPLTSFFKNIRTFTVGRQEVFDIKKAMTPLVDLVRVYALKNRILKVNTGERLKALKEAGVFSETAYQELHQSYYYLMGMRLKRQANQIIAEKREPDNYIDMASLTKLEQGTLREIFKSIQDFQTRIRLEYTNNIFG